MKSPKHSQLAIIMLIWLNLLPVSSFIYWNPNLMTAWLHGISSMRIWPPETCPLAVLRIRFSNTMSWSNAAAALATRQFDLVTKPLQMAGKHCPMIALNDQDTVFDRSPGPTLSLESGGQGR